MAAACLRLLTAALQPPLPTPHTCRANRFVECEPDVLRLPMRPLQPSGTGDAFVVLASDGLWDAASDADVVAWVEATVKHPAMAAKRLATEAVDRGSGDNVAVVVAYLEPVATLERVHF